MRILQLIDAPRRRGAEVFARQLTDGLGRKGHDVLLVAMRSASAAGGTLKVDQTVGGWNGRGLSLAAVRKVARIARSCSADVVQANGGSTPKCAALAKILSPRGRWKLVYRNIGDPSFWISSPLQRAFYRRVVWPRFDGVVSVSRQGRDGLRRVYGSGGPRIEVIYQGVDDGSLMATVSRSDVRCEMGTPETSVVLIWVGALSNEKRPDRALRVMSALKREGTSAVLWMVGAGPLSEELTGVARDLGIEESVRWVGAVENVGTYLHAADIFVLTSDTEGIPGALLEAMTVGLPCVATNVGGISEILTEGRTGLFREPDDELGLAECVERLIRDVDLRHELGSDAQRDAVVRFSMENCVTKYEAFYNEMMADERLRE